MKLSEEVVIVQSECPLLPLVLKERCKMLAAVTGCHTVSPPSSVNSVSLVSYTLE